MKYFKRATSLLLAITILALANISGVAAASTTTFTDVKTTAWYYNYVNKLVNLKITSGVGNNKFAPNNTVTRAEFVTFLCKTMGHVKTQGDPFSDTQKHWASGYITIALANGIMDLPKDKKFRPDAAITRQEAVEMMCRALNVSNELTTKNPYADIKTADSKYTNLAYANYLMQGTIEKGKRLFKPLGKLTRGEVAAVIVNAYNYNADKMAFLNEKITAAKAKAAAEKAEQDRLAAWKESVKGIPSELLSNTEGLYKNSVYESNKYLKTESGYLSGWGKDYGMADEEFANEIVRVGNDIMNLWYNADYRKVDELEKGFRTLGATNFINNSIKRNLDYVKNNKFVSEGSFKTSTGLIVFTDSGLLALRGTIKYRYLKPTSNNVLNSEIVGTTGKPIQLEVSYEQDIQIRFYPEKDGLKFTRMDAISDIRLSK